MLSGALYPEHLLGCIADQACGSSEILAEIKLESNRGKCIAAKNIAVLLLL